MIRVALSLVLLAPAPAWACGGFFCDRDFPIDQSSEQIVFGVDEDSGTVTAHVQIAYQGASEDFAWVVPVSGVPELFVSSDALFTTLKAFTEPTFWLDYEQQGVCDVGWGRQEFALEMDSGAVDEDGDNGVTVISEQQVGPYDTVVLQAESSAELLTWLQSAGYDLPTNLDPVLAPYVASGQYFVALKLSAGKDTGDLQPLGMTYPGTAASIPIQLTSIAATPDMRLEVYVMGDARAVPDNYLHVTINEAAINWFEGGSNYEEVITLAADEAGGHAFATDFAGPTAQFRGMFWTDGRYDLDHLRSINDPILWTQELLNMGFPGSSSLLNLFLTLIPYPEELAAQGVTPQNFYDCLECYAEYVDGTGFSGAEATAKLETDVIDGLRAAEKMLTDYSHMSRLTSSLDAVEMTVDPIFVFNRDLPQDVTNLHRATVVVRCGTLEGDGGAEQDLVLADGRRIPLPSQEWLERHDMTAFEVIEPLTFPKAILIEDLGAEGLGEVIFDWRDEAADEARQFGRAGCGCSTGASPIGALGVLFAGLFVRRRRNA
jgi:MYXO-CTERM domain-containing protein